MGQTVLYFAYFSTLEFWVTPMQKRFDFIGYPMFLYFFLVYHIVGLVVCDSLWSMVCGCRPLLEAEAGES